MQNLNNAGNCNIIIAASVSRNRKQLPWLRKFFFIFLPYASICLIVTFFKTYYWIIFVNFHANCFSDVVNINLTLQLLADLEMLLQAPLS